MVENYDIRIKEDGSRVVVRNLEDLAASADKAYEAADKLIKRLQAMSRLSADRINAYGSAWSAAAKQMNEAADAAERLSRATSRIKTPRPSPSTPGGSNGGGSNYPLATVGSSAVGAVSGNAASSSGGGLILRGGNKFMGMVEEVNATSTAMSGLRSRAFEVRDGFDRIQQTAVPAMTDIQRLMAGVAAYFAVDKLIQYADAWAMLAGRMAVTTKTQEEAVYMTEQLYQIAQRTRAPIQEMSSLYQNLNIASKNLGNSQKDTLRFTELVGQALAVQKVPAATARGALLQLGQALDSGKVRAQEFNSVNLGVPYIMKIVAENIKGAGGNIALLRQQMIAGKLTSKEFFDAFMAGGSHIDADFAKTRQTFAQSFVVMENAAAKYFGQLNEGLGISVKFAAATKYIAENIETVGNVAIVAAVGLGAMLAPAALGGLATLAVTAASALLLIAGPVGIVLGLIAAAAAAVVLFGNELKLGTANGAGFLDLLTAMWREASTQFKAIWDLAVKYITPLTEVFDGAFKKISFGDIYMMFAKLIDYIVGGSVAGVTAVIAAFAQLPVVVPELLKTMYNKVVDLLEGSGSKILDVVDQMRVAAGQPIVVRLKTEKFEVNENVIGDYITFVAGAAKESFDRSSHVVTDSVKRMFDAADKIAKDRQKNIPDGLDIRTKPMVGPEDDKAYRKAENALRTLVQATAPAYAARLQLAHAEKVLGDAVREGVLSQDKQKNGFESANFYLKLVQEHYKDIADPMGKFIRDLQKETEYLSLDNRERVVAIAVEAELQKLKKTGVAITKEELERRGMLLTMAIEENETAKRQASIRDSAMSGSSGRQMRDLKEQLAIIEQLKKNKKITPEDAFNSAMQNSGLGEMFSGTEDARQAELARYREMYEKVDELRRAGVVSEQSAAQAKMRIAAAEMEYKLSTTQTVLGAMATLMKSGNRKAFEIGKAAAIAEATISGVLAVQKALGSAPPPWNYALAAAVGVSSAMNVSKIMAQTPGFEAGGYTGNYGRSQVAGVVHGQEYVVNADATARNRPLLEAMNAGGTIGGSGGAMYIQNNINVHVSGTDADSSGGNTDLGLELQEAVEATVMRVIYKEKRQGGALSN